MDARIILAGQPVNVLSTMAQGQGLAANQAQMQRTGEEWNLYRTHGAGIAEGDTNALRALAGFDPMAALNARGAHQEMAHADERMQLARAAAARAAQTHAAGLTAAERADMSERIGRGLATAIPALRAGDLAAVQTIFRTGGLEVPETLDDAAFVIAGYEAALPAFEAARAVMGAGAGPEMTTAMQTLHQRAVAAGLEPGTPAYQEFMATGGRVGDFMEFTMPDGTTFRTGTGAGAVAPVAPTPAGGELAPPPALEGADEAFGLGGALRFGANTLADAVGAPVPFPGANAARADIEMAAEDLLNATAGAYDRQPPSWLLQELRRLVPRPGSPFIGVDRARTQYGALMRRLETEIQQAHDTLRATRDPGVRAEQHALISGHGVMLARIDQIMRGMFPEEGGTRRTAGGIEWSIVE